MTVPNTRNGYASLAALSAQVSGLDRDYQELKRSVASLDLKLDTTFAQQANRFEQAINTLHSKLDERSQTAWPTIWAGLGVVFIALTSLGGALYWPIQRDTSRLDVIQTAILDKGVFSKQYESDQARTIEALRLLRQDYNTSVQQPRYTADQERLTINLKHLDEQIQFVRQNFMRSDQYDKQHRELRVLVDRNHERIEKIDAQIYGNQGRISRLEALQ